MRSIRLTAAVLLFFVSPLFAVERVSSDPNRDLSCGTTDATLRRVRAVADRAEQKHADGRIRSSSAGSASLLHGMFAIGADSLNSPHKRVVDLQQTSFRLTKSVDGSYGFEKVPFTLDSDPGTAVKSLNRTSQPDWHYVRVPLKGYSFPFFEQSYDAVYVTAFAAIEFALPRLSPLQQYTPLDAAAQTTPMIAALATTAKNPSTFVYPIAYVKHLTDATRITWHGLAEEFAYEIQLTLNKSGEVLLTYGAVKGLTWGSFIFTSGQESWRSRVASIATASDAGDDVDSSFYEAIRPMVDIRSVEVNRVASTDLIEVRLKLGAPLNRSAIRSGDALQYFVVTGGVDQLWNGAILEVPANEDHSYIVNGVESAASSAARIEGDTISLLVLQDQLAIPDGSESVPLLVFTSAWSNNNFGDKAEANVTFGTATASAMLDMSETTTASSDRPLFESFTLTSFNPHGVWSALKAQYQFTDADIDGVAMYQTFYTDIVFYAGAYSTVGNPGADGIGYRMGNYGTRYGRRPALLHMNKFDYGYNRQADRSGHVSLHEFGHRWLLHVAVKEGTSITRALNPISAHPAQYVHAPAAFNLVTSSDSSVMGGSSFTDQGNGTFRSGPSASYGYSWLDLYLMGLAAPEEVPPFFYISDTNPPLGGAYYPPANTVVSGKRRDIGITNVLDAMGSRTPSTAEAQRSFKVLFVLVTEPGTQPTTEQWNKMIEHRRVFETNFTKATGGRGAVSTFYSEPVPGRRRLIRR